jgi:HTH-type transcriptional regulator / antitoxin HigA
MPKVIKTDDDYRLYRKEVERLALLDPSPESAEGARLELLSFLVEAYEKKHFPFEGPDPIEAILFRMNEQGLRQVDLVSYFGSRSRVSEVLGGKRPLTVQMIRDVSRGLGIPAQALLSSPGEREEKKSIEVQKSEIDWEKFPAREMLKRGYFRAAKPTNKLTLVDAARRFYQSVIGTETSTPLLARQSLRGDAMAPRSQYALLAWKARVLSVARNRRAHITNRYRSGALSDDFLTRVAQLSWLPNGPQVARSVVESIGIPVVFERHLTGTYLDGAAILDHDCTPVIALTIRFDRLDNFWYTLLHELVHVAKHLSMPGDTFFDRLEDREGTTQLEKEANRIARDTFIPRHVWKRSPVSAAPTEQTINQLAADCRIHAAIVAGRVRRELGQYNKFSTMLGTGEVKKQFPEIQSS